MADRGPALPPDTVPTWKHLRTTEDLLARVLKFEDFKQRFRDADQQTEWDMLIDAIAEYFETKVTKPCQPN